MNERAPFGEVEAEVVGMHGGDHRCVLVAGAAQGDPHPGHGLVHREGLGHVVVRTEVERFHLVDGVSATREHDDGLVAAVAHATENLDAITIRQAQVQSQPIPSRRGPGPAPTP